ncbi:hypothetical protein JIG36_15855 [Actinoplanes sp. LDG1-06]|uniref:Uncharacterized protein n=1 Tax=Paractinoplanes ovalisporus TaxID=2810368 RepID=A0ABS2AB29_9ACTN|nr:hypothetical protein [Actinoplanes ovalisporus]MBM2617032.1 hypothetical protein [Actinoplanes ovalisporus]
MATNFDLAPPPVTVSGRTAVPIDISTVRARLTFDGASGTATGEARVEFVAGPTAGCPIFDLRQTITGVVLDGTPLTPAQVLTANLGGGTGADLRVLDSVVAAGSAHTLDLTWSLGPPNSPAGGSYPPALTWSAGPRLTFTFGFTDLAPARYLESWLPANLLWDQYAIDLELVVTGTSIAHRPITNGTVTTLGPNHWRVAFPQRFTAFSPMLEIRAVDTLASVTGTVHMPVSSAPLTVEVVKLAANTTFDLAAELARLSTWLPANEQAIGRYVHGDRFTAFLIQGGMEYEGGCTATPGSLRHEAFHSWWGRGVKPASQADGWWDEAWNTYHDSGGTGVRPYDFSEPPNTLSPRNPYFRVTPTASYPAGERFFAGAAALTSPADLTGWMNEFYREHLSRPTTTEALEAHLVARSGAADLVDAFHRWIYGFGDPAPGPDLWLRDDPAHTGGEQWNGRFWDSPDLWIRNADDGGTTHQEPRAGQDNWFYARIRNQGGGIAQHFVVTFHVRPFAGVQFTWPTDFLPSLTAVTGFGLAPGQSTVVKARWPAAAVPAPGTHACWLAAVHARSDRPIAGAHVWEHGNLAQKNLTVVRPKPGHAVLVPFVARGIRPGETAGLEIRRPAKLADFRVRIVRSSPEPPEAPFRPAEVVSGDEKDVAAGGFDLHEAVVFADGRTATQRLPMPLGSTRLGLLIEVPKDALRGTHGTIDLVRVDRDGRPMGGLAISVLIDR